MFGSRSCGPRPKSGTLTGLGYAFSATPPGGRLIAALLLDCRAVFDIEYTALQMLAEADVRLETAGIALWVTGLNPQALAVVRRSPFGERLGDRRMFPNLDAAIQEYERQQAAFDHA